MRLLTESEVSEILRCTKAALRRWRREERGPRFIRVGRLIRYRAYRGLIDCRFSLLCSMRRVPVLGSHGVEGSSGP